MRNFLSELSNGVKKNLANIILVIGVILISLLSFAMGYIVAKQQEKEPLKIEQYEKSESSHCWSRDLRVISGMEII